MTNAASLGADRIRRMLQDLGYRFFSGVPCSYFKHLITEIEGEEALRYIDAANEGVALAACSGASLAGAKSVCLLQNSGFGNLLNPLTSLSMIYNIPTLLVISLRAYPDEFEDEPQHRVIGRSLPSMLDILGLPYRFLARDAETFCRDLGELDRVIEAGQSAALLVRKGVISKGRTAARRPALRSSLSRKQAIEVIADLLPDNAVVVSTTGMISRELFAVRDRAETFYMQGSMGHAPAIALGVAAFTQGRPIIVLDGDGAVLMHLGALATTGHHKPRKFLHVILDNEAYSTTGNQPTASRTTRLEKVAVACGYADAARCETSKEIRSQFPRMLDSDGPACLVIKVNHETGSGTPRVTNAYAPEETALRFREALADV